MDIPMPGHPHQSAELLRANVVAWWSVVWGVGWWCGGVVGHVDARGRSDSQIGGGWWWWGKEAKNLWRFRCDFKAFLMRINTFNYIYIYEIIYYVLYIYLQCPAESMAL